MSTHVATTKEALKAALEIVERCMSDLKLAQTASQKQILKDECRKHLELAEQYKVALNEQHLLSAARTTSLVLSQNSRNNTAQPPPMGLRVPKCTRKLSNREQIILLRGSKLNGCLFPPWTSPPPPDEFSIGHAGIFTDPFELSLSESQQVELGGWDRPGLSRIRNEGAREGDVNSPEMPATMATPWNTDLVQDMTSDCSVVASLCAGVARAQKGHPKVLETTMFPYDTVNRRPAISANGKYVFQFYFNGCTRKVVIDDRLPKAKSNRALHVTDRSEPALLWPALVEKAYLKIRGGYDFPGSNSATDLAVLTGWIPEQVSLWLANLDHDCLWRRVYRAYQHGDVLVTVGTGQLSPQEEEDLHLANEHDYAIIDMKEGIDGLRQLLVKNPWVEGDLWQGRPGESRPRATKAADGVSEDPTNPIIPGSFWITLGDTVQYFKFMYLNWNPGLFTYRQDYHFTWDLTKKRSASGAFDENPQFQLSSNSENLCWILLSRHFEDPLAKNPNAADDVEGYIALYAFEGDGYRVTLSDKFTERTSYLESIHILLRMECKPKATFTIVVSEESLPPLSYNFSISFFSIKPLVVREASNKYPYSVVRDGSWNFSTAGGPVNSPMYTKNPQFGLTIRSITDLSILLTIPDSDTSIHVKLLWAQGRRITSVTNRDVISDSGSYRKGSALCEAKGVQPGSYIAICSTFRPGQCAGFGLHVRSTESCALNAIPAEGAGRLSTKVPRLMFKQGTDRYLAPLQLQRVTQVRTVARRHIAGSNVDISPLRISLEHGQGPNKRILRLSGNGDFVSKPDEIILDDLDIQPSMIASGGIWLVVERLGTSYVHCPDAVDIELFSEGPVQVGPWGQEE